MDPEPLVSDARIIASNRRERTPWCRCHIITERILAQRATDVKCRHGLLTVERGAEDPRRQRDATTREAAVSPAGTVAPPARDLISGSHKRSHLS